MYSSFGSDFNYDFHVTMDESVTPVEYNYRTPEDHEQAGTAYYFAGEQPSEQPGTSCFLRDGDRVFHTYSSPRALSTNDPEGMLRRNDAPLPVHGTHRTPVAPAGLRYPRGKSSARTRAKPWSSGLSSRSSRSSSSATSNAAEPALDRRKTNTSSAAVSTSHSSGRPCAS